MEPLAEPHAIDGVAIGRMSLNKQFIGDSVAVGVSEMLTALTPVRGSAGYVAIATVSPARFTAARAASSFSTAARSIKARSSLPLQWCLDPARGALDGIAGTFSISVVDGEHAYEFAYNSPS